MAQGGRGHAAPVHAVSSTFVVSPALAQELMEAAQRRDVTVVVRADRGASGADFATVQPGVILPAAAKAANALLQQLGMERMVECSAIRLLHSDHRGGDVHAYKLRITCADGSHAHALEQGIAAQGGLVMQWGDRQHVPGMLLNQGQPTDATYFVRLCSRNTLRPDFVRSLLKDMGIDPVWVARVQLPQEGYGDAAMGGRSWGDGLQPDGEAAALGVHPYLLGSVSEAASREHTSDECHYLALIDGCHAAVNKRVEEVRAGAGINLQVPAGTPQGPHGFRGMRISLFRHIPRLPKAAQQQQGGAATPASHLPATATWAAPMVAPAAPDVVPPPAAANAPAPAPPPPMAEPGAGNTQQPEGDAPQDCSPTAGSDAAGGAAAAGSHSSVQLLHTVDAGRRPLQLAEQANATSRHRGCVDGEGDGDLRSKRRALLPGDGRMEEDPPADTDGGADAGAGTQRSGGGAWGAQVPTPADADQQQPSGDGGGAWVAPLLAEVPAPPHAAAQQ